MAPQILLVDDNATNLQILYQTLDGHGYRLLAARNGADAVAAAQRAQPDLVLLDVMMPGMDGFETCARLKADARTKDAAIIFLSAVTEAREKARGLELGAVDFINKPFQAEEVVARVRTHLTIRDLQRELVRRNRELEHELSVAQELLRDARERTDGVLLGDSEAAARLRKQVREAAATDDTVLISGPPGSDHEAVARAVHHLSSRGSRAIICVAGFSDGGETTSMSSLAKTGEIPGTIDKWRLAHGGTLYLEGVQNLPHAAQLVLAGRLRMLDETRRTGGPDADVRVILSTTREVDAEIEAGHLIPELRRAAARTLDLVPLRTRIDDLPVLARFILQRQADQAGRPAPALSDDSLKRLKNYRWPGNLRELRNVLGAALAATDGPVLEIGDHLLNDGVRIGSYTLIQRLGSGGMGEVWEARHQLLARPAAVKLVREGAGMKEDAPLLRQRFAREAHATAALQSPHTVQLFDFGLTDAGGFYYVMERLHGTDLQKMVERYGAIAPERAVYLLKQACLSLSEAHALGLVHRDIKPANLFLCRLGAEYDFVKVLDFGMVSRHGREVASISGSGAILGTPAYLAPELASSQPVFDHRADIYALGCVAFWLLTGKTPFEGASAAALLMHHAKTPPRAPSAVAASRIPAELDDLVLACLAKDPSLRPAGADELRERLDRVPVPVWEQQRARAWWTAHEAELVGQVAR
jgi:DNA-binding NtrC family response regulator